MEAQEERLATYSGGTRPAGRRGAARGRAKQGSPGGRPGARREVRNPHSRYGQALAEHYDVKDPYGSLARSAMAEYGDFLRDRENLDRQIAKAEDPKERETLELRKRIEAADYMAITSDRIAQQSYIIQGKPILRDKDRDPSKSLEEQLADRPDVNKEFYVQTERAAAFRKEAQELRTQYRDLQAERFRDREEGMAAPEAIRREPEPEAPRETARTPQPIQDKEPERSPVKAEKATPGHEAGSESTPGSLSRKSTMQGRERGGGDRRKMGRSFQTGSGRRALHPRPGWSRGTTITRFRKEDEDRGRGRERLRLSPRSGARRGRAEGFRGARSGHESRRASQSGRGPARQKDIRNTRRRTGSREKAAPAIMVQERQPGKPRGESQPLQDFVKGLPEAKEPSHLSPAELRNNPAAKRAHYEQDLAKQQRGPALDLNAGRK